MQNKIHGLSIKILIIATLLFLIGCASDPVPTYLPANHPANPEAAEAAFSPGPNPFADNMLIEEIRPMETPPMSHGGHINQQSHKMKPDQSHDKKSKETNTEASDHRH